MERREPGVVLRVGVSAQRKIITDPVQVALDAGQVQARLALPVALILRFQRWAGAAGATRKKEVEEILIQEEDCLKNMFLA